MSDNFLTTATSELNLTYAFDAEINGERCFNWNHQLNDNSNALLVSGPNASGKSLFMTYMQLCCKDAKIAKRAVCMANRTSSGMEKVFIFGDEHEQSTGATSIGVVVNCAESSQNEDSKPWMAIFDEPDIGLSEGYQKAMGAYIGQFMVANSENPLCKGIIIVSHCKALMREALKYASDANTMYMDEKVTFKDWLEREEPAYSVDELLALRKLGADRKAAVWRTQELAKQD